MLSVRVRYLGRFRDITGKCEEVVLFDGGTLMDLLGFLVSVYGKRFSVAVFDKKNGRSLREDIIILVDQKPVGDNVFVSLRDNSVVSILPFVSGG